MNSVWRNTKNSSEVRVWVVVEWDEMEVRREERGEGGKEERGILISFFFLLCAF